LVLALTVRPAEAPAAQQVLRAKFAVFTPPGGVPAIAAKKLAKLTSQYTNGTVQITVYPSGVLGSVPSVLQALRNNTIQFAATIALDSIVPEAETTLLPYLFPSVDVAQEVLNGPVVRDKLWSKFDAHGMHIVGVWSQGFADLLTTRKVTSIADVQGLRLRVFSPLADKGFYTALGANATPLELNQVFTALSTHAIDGLDDPPGTLAAAKFYNVAHYLALTEQLYVTAPVEVSTGFWSSMSPSQRSGFMRAWNEVMPGEVREAKALEASSIKEMQAAGTVVSPVDKQAFKAKAAAVYQALEKKFPGIVPAIQAAVASAR
jgi:tripartite ATP-independent transporter DctP family solute receptor